MTAAMTERAHEAGKAVHAWTVNTKSEMEEMKMAGVDNIITDYPVEAREICYREEAAEGLLERLRLLCSNLNGSAGTFAAAYRTAEKNRKRKEAEYASVLQRVLEASVSVEGEEIGRIGKGFFCW